MTLLKRIIKSGFISFKRNSLISWASILIVTITLSVITTIILLQAVLNYSLNQIENKVDVTIYFNVDASQDKILSLKNSLEKLPEVESVSYTTAEEALAVFRERHTSDYSTIQALDEIGENPLGGYLNVKAKEVSQYEAIANFLKSDNLLVSGSSSIIDKVNYHQNKIVIEKLNSIISGAQKLGFLITLVLIVISIIITLNTIRLAIFIAKEEIGVMRLVGASKMRVRGPFMIEGAIYGFIATIITLLLFWPATAWLGRNMTGFLGLNLYDYFVSNIFQIFCIVLFSGVFLGMVSSLLAIRRYLNK
ncbi:MAG TPA: permease-like cell division protein FtsX [Candidatus Paceibacterota bacterium]|nr:permease-like cell division protein FtsX [Candidatus Paceibacterota bacterium]HPT18366.1 permease-like cell division protein FtsX [Candidatus Paceibacterota bacterium]